MATSQNTQPTQDTATTSFTSTSSSSSVFETNELKKYRKYWWNTLESQVGRSNLATEIPFETYVEHTDKYNIHGWWEWENGTVRVIELPTAFHENCVGTIVREISGVTIGVKSTKFDILYFGSTTTKSHGSGKEADASWRPLAKPRVIRGGFDISGTQPWPNLIVEVAYTEPEWKLINKVEQYWLRGGRAHDAIAIKIEEPIAPNTIPSVMTAWHYCINNQTAVGAFNTTMYEFGTVDRGGNAIVNLQPGQRVINIQLACLYHGVPANVLNPPPPPPLQPPQPNPIATIPNPIVIDLYHVRFAILNCIV